MKHFLYMIILTSLNTILLTSCNNTEKVKLTKLCFGENCGSNNKDNQDNSTDDKTAMPNPLYDNNLLMPSEGGSGKPFNDGASWFYFNKGAKFKWANIGGDFIDADGVDQGVKPWAVQTITDTNSIKEITWDVTSLVKAWRNEEISNRGFHIRHVSGSNGSIDYASKENLETTQQPKLVVTTQSVGDIEFSPIGDTQLTSSTTTLTFGQEQTMRVRDKQNVLVWFDLSPLEGKVIISSELKITTTAQYSNSDSVHGVFAIKTKTWDVSAPIEGLAANFPNDNGLINHPDVFVQYSFDTNQTSDGGDILNGSIDPGHSENFWPCNTQSPIGKQKDGIQKSAGFGIPGYKAMGGSGNAVCARLKFEEGTANTPGIGNYGIGIRKKVRDFYKQDQIEELYVRMYLYLGDSWGENTLNEGGKRPGGITGTQSGFPYAAGWGGRRTTGANGWSARGGYFRQVPYGHNPLAGYTPLATYLYHADQTSGYGDSISWDEIPNGLIKKGRWYCLEQHVKINSRDGNNILGSSGANDGIVEGWVDGRLVFRKTNIRFTDMDYINIDVADFGIYFGGWGNTPYDQHMAMDNIVISKKYIGPMKKE